MITVAYNQGRTVEVPVGTSYRKIAEMVRGDFASDIVLVRSENKLKELHKITKGSETVSFITGTIDSFEAEGYTDANGRWTWTEGAASPTVSTSNGVRRLSFALGTGQSLEYHPQVACPTNGTADVVVSNALLHVATMLPTSANPDHQASITAARPAGESEAAYYGWAGAMTNGA